MRSRSPCLFDGRSMPARRLPGAHARSARPEPAPPAPYPPQPSRWGFPLAAPTPSSARTRAPRPPALLAARYEAPRRAAPLAAPFQASPFLAVSAGYAPACAAPLTLKATRARPQPCLKFRLARTTGAAPVWPLALPRQPRSQILDGALDSQLAPAFICIYSVWCAPSCSPDFFQALPRLHHRTQAAHNLQCPALASCGLSCSLGAALLHQRRLCLGSWQCSWGATVGTGAEDLSRSS